eukprot:10917699-Lingulodinium_polyedra.AAC.1
MASALVRWTLEAATASRRSCMLLFVDIKAAYYSVLHALLDPHEFTERSLEQVLDEVEVPLAYYEPIKLMLQEPGSIDQDLADVHLAELLKESVR